MGKGRVQAIQVTGLLLTVMTVVGNPGHSVDPMWGSMEKGPVPPSTPNIPGPLATKTGQRAGVSDTVAPLLESPKKASVRPPAAPNGHSVDLLASMVKGPVRPSAPNPVTYIPGPPSTITSERAVMGHKVAKNGTARPPAAPSGDPIAPSTT